VSIRDITIDSLTLALPEAFPQTFGDIIWKEEGISSENAKRVRSLERTMPFLQAVERI